MEPKSSSFQNILAERLDGLRRNGLYRELRRVESPQGRRITIAGTNYLNFSSNDYLGLSTAPELADAAREAIGRFGAGAGASRLICGSLSPYHELEETLARFKGTESALYFSTGYAAAVGTICALVGSDDVIVIDRLVHASIVDAARLSGAKLRVFAHNDLEDLEKMLRWAGERNTNPQHPSRTLIVTESIFSMDGDQAPLRAIVELKDRYGAWLMVDEAHATGVLGKRHCGLAEEQGVADRIEIQMGTLGKAVGASGGYICGAQVLVDYLVNRARSFVFSTAPVPAAAAAATAGLRLIQSEAGEKRCAQLWQRVEQLLQGVAALQGRSAALQATSAIIPLIIGPEVTAMEVAGALRRRGIYIPAIRYPTVARGEARLRITLTAAHTQADVEELLAALNSVFKNLQNGFSRA